MKTQMRLFLLLLIGICFLSVFSCMAAADSAIAVAQTADTTSHTYHYSKNHITDIQITVPNAEVNFYMQSLQEEIVVQVTGGAIEGAETEKTLSLHSDAQQHYRLDIYLPERFYNVEILGEVLEVQTLHTMRGVMKIRAHCLEAVLEDYCGGISFVAEEGAVSIEKGNLQKASTVTLLEKGNIYLHTKLTDCVGISSFSTNQGAVKVWTDTLETDTFFEVSALSVSGEYSSLPADGQKNTNCKKIQIISQNGLAIFYN